MTNKKKSDIRFAFFGNAPLAEPVLAHLKDAGFVPSTLITESLTDEDVQKLKSSSWDFFVVASYGAILPKQILSIPSFGVLNVHPSLLPRLRGASPIRTAILNDEKEVGVTIMLLDEEMDHGPVLAQKKVALGEWPPHGRDLDALLADEGGKLLAEIVLLWLRGEIEAHPQNHDIATYCTRFKKEDGLLDLSEEAYTNLLKIRAFEGWPGTYTFFERAGKKLRVQILDAHLEGNKLVIDKVKPEGKKEMSYAEFLRGGARELPGR